MRKEFLIFFLIIYFYKINAYAYLDPGTGSIIISTIIAFFVALWGYIKIYYTKIKVVCQVFCASFFGIFELI